MVKQKEHRNHWGLRLLKEIVHYWWLFLIAYASDAAFGLYSLMASEGIKGLFKTRDLLHALSLDWLLLLFTVSPLIGAFAVISIVVALTTFSLLGWREHLRRVRTRQRMQVNEIADKVIEVLRDRGII